MFNLPFGNFNISQVTNAFDVNNIAIPDIPNISIPEIPSIPEITPQLILEKAGIPVNIESLAAQAKLLEGATQEKMQEALAIADAAGRARSALAQLDINQIGGDLTSALSGVGGDLTSALSGVEGNLTSALSGVGGDLTSALSGVEGNLTSALSGIGGGLGGLTGGLGGLTGGLGGLTGGLGGLTGGLGGLTGGLGGIGGGLRGLTGGSSGGGSKSLPALSYPSDVGSDNVKDYIVFIAYSGDVGGYTKFGTGDSSSGGEPEGTVQLYIPENLAVNSQVGYQNTNQGSVVGALANLKEGGSASWDGAISFITDIAGVSLQSLGDSGGVSAQVSGAGVGAANRHVLFEGVDFRTFSYSYEFLPKSWEESVKLKEIIKFFRVNMLPEVKVNGNTFKPPNWFSIEYMIDGKSTEYLNKIKPSVCTGCDVSYGGNGQFAMFQSDKGETPAPALINLTLTFQEVQVVSKVDAQEGY